MLSKGIGLSEDEVTDLIEQTKIDFEVDEVKRDIVVDVQSTPLY